MTGSIAVFVNDRAVRVPPGVPFAQAIAVSDDGLGRAVADGTALVTDGRGIGLDPASPVYPGAIVRVVISARRAAGGADADA